MHCYLIPYSPKLPYKRCIVKVVASCHVLISFLRLQVYLSSRGSWGVAGSEKFFTSPNKVEDGGGVSIKIRSMNLPGGLISLGVLAFYICIIVAALNLIISKKQLSLT